MNENNHFPEEFINDIHDEFMNNIDDDDSTISLEDIDSTSIDISSDDSNDNRSEISVEDELNMLYDFRNTDPYNAIINYIDSENQIKQFYYNRLMKINIFLGISFALLQIGLINKMILISCLTASLVMLYDIQQMYYSRFYLTSFDSVSNLKFREYPYDIFWNADVIGSNALNNHIHPLFNYWNQWNNLSIYRYIFGNSIVSLINLFYNFDFPTKTMIYSRNKLNTFWLHRTEFFKEFKGSEFMIEVRSNLNNKLMATHWIKPDLENGLLLCTNCDYIG